MIISESAELHLVNMLTNQLIICLFTPDQVSVQITTISSLRTTSHSVQLV